jgi:hypothetical protein
MSIYENRKMKAVEIVLRREGVKRDNDGANPTKVYFKYICKYYNYYTTYNMYNI